MYFGDIVLLISQKLQQLQQVIFEGKLSNIILFKLCKFNVNLWTVCFVWQKVPQAFKV